MSDTSKEYCLMCEKAYKYLSVPATTELGNLWAIKVKDRRKYVYVVNHYFKKPREDERYRYNSYFPIYRQDQLQEMISKDINKLIPDFYNFNQRGYSHKFNSMEQLWLVFLMWLFYKKQWNGKDWEIYKINLDTNSEL